MSNKTGLDSSFHNSKKSSALYRWEVVQPGTAGRGRKWHINSAADLSAQTLLTCLCLLSVCHRLFTRDFFFFLLNYFKFCICCVLETPPLVVMCFSHRILLIFYRFYKPGTSWRETADNLGPLTLTSPFTHAPPLEKTHRICRVQCMSESSYNFPESDRNRNTKQ